jgi:hypothetical protein
MSPNNYLIIFVFVVHERTSVHLSGHSAPSGVCNLKLTQYLLETYKNLRQKTLFCGLSRGDKAGAAAFAYHGGFYCAGCRDGLAVRGHKGTRPMQGDCLHWRGLSN